jgi:hypothetical protein
MARWTTLVLVLALTAASARQLTCVWECSEPSTISNAGAPCHETVAEALTLAASAGHCPLAPDAAIIAAAKGGEPQRQRLTVPFDKIASPRPPLAHQTATRASFTGSPQPTPTPPARQFSVLRI